MTIRWKFPYIHTCDCWYSSTESSGQCRTESSGHWGYQQTQSGLLVMMDILTCTIIVCAGPLQRAWLALRSCCRTGGDTGGAYQGTLHQCHSDSHMIRQLLSPSGHNMYPYNPGYGHNVGATNTCVCESNVISPAIGVEMGGGRTPLWSAWQQLRDGWQYGQLEPDNEQTSGLDTMTCQGLICLWIFFLCFTFLLRNSGLNHQGVWGTRGDNGGLARYQAKISGLQENGGIQQGIWKYIVLNLLCEREYEKAWIIHHSEPI